MTKFIELTNCDNKLPILINVDMIVAIEPYDDNETYGYPKACVHVSEDIFDITESYEEVKKKIKACETICSEIIKR